MLFTAIHNFTAKELLPRAERLAVALGVVALLSVAWLSAEHESRDAVFSAAGAMTAKVMHIILPTVEVSAHKAA
jgi:hypothetical protein